MRDDEKPKDEKKTEEKPKDEEKPAEKGQAARGPFIDKQLDKAVAVIKEALAAETAKK